MLQFFSNLADFIGILAFAFSGLLAGKERRLDPVGIFVLAFTTAFGGGILRDVVVHHARILRVAHAPSYGLRPGSRQALPSRYSLRRVHLA